MPDPQSPQGKGPTRRAVILTALPVEYQAVQAHLSDLEEKTHKGSVYEVGNFPGHAQHWEVLLVEVGPGNPGAAMEAERSINYFNPQVALFVGVAGGLKDVKLGDIVAATKVYGYESAKAGEDLQPRADIGRSSYRMEQRARAETKKPDWQERIIGSVPTEPPDAFVKPIAAGEKVVADTRSATYEFLKANFGDALAVEMEGIGFITATHACHPVEALIIRGISDLVHDKAGPNEKVRQDTASRHAAAFAFEVLAKLDLEDQGQVTPASPARIGNVRHPRNRNFTGRAQLLEDLRQSLASGQVAALTALHGLGGVGKTQLALEYAYRLAPEYDLVWWGRAEAPAALAADYAELAVKLDLPEQAAAEQEIAVAAVRRELGRRGKWLLIFDNAGAPGDLEGYIPPGGGGHVVITSRNPVWREVARPLDVKVWERPESVAFLLKRTGREEAADASKLAEELGDLPLALAQAGAYIDECGDTLAHYLNLFRSRRRELLKRGKISQDYPDTVATTWELSFQQVQAASPAAADLLNLGAFLAPDDIPKEMLEQGAAHLPEPLAGAVRDPITLNEVFTVLRRYSLLEVSGDALALHRLVQAVARDRLDDAGRKQWAGAAVEMVNAAFPYIELENWPWCARLLPQAQAAAGHAEGLKVGLPAAGRLLNQCGFYLRIRAEFAGARAHFERALAIDEAAYGPEHPEVATDVNNLGSVLRALGDLAGARAHFERALGIDEAAYGPDHPNVARDVNNLGYVLRALGDLAGARTHFERALAIDEAAYGPDHPEVATDVNNLGSVLQALGDLAGARAHYERALAIDEATYGPDHPEVATDANNLGFVLQALGDLAGARAHYARALAICRRFLGADHPTTKLVRDNLARLALPGD